MPLIFYSVAALVAYLLGSIPFGYLLVRFFRKEDIRQKGSGNIGATNVMRSGSKGLGAVTFLLDVLKGFFAVWLCGMVAARSGLTTEIRTNAIAIAALFVVLGHIYTVWLGFKGGKGVATAFGVFLALSSVGGAGRTRPLRSGLRGFALRFAGIDPFGSGVSFPGAVDAASAAHSVGHSRALHHSCHRGPAAL